MSLKLQSNGGGSVTIADPASTASNFTLNPPLRSGQLAVDGPAFSAYGSALQSFANATFTKVAYNTKEFDTNTNFDTASNRFTPTVAGYYLITASFSFSGSASGAVIASVYKNGSEFKRCFVVPNSGAGPVANIATVLFANGSTDYFEIYGWQNSGGAINCGSANSQQCFTASMVRAA